MPANATSVIDSAFTSYEAVSGLLVTVAVFFIIYHFARKSSGGKLMSKEDQDKASMEMLARDNSRLFDDENADLVNRQECERLCAEIAETDELKRMPDYEALRDKDYHRASLEQPGLSYEEYQDQEYDATTQATNE